MLYTYINSVLNYTVCFNQNELEQVSNLAFKIRSWKLFANAIRWSNLFSINIYVLWNKLLLRIQIHLDVFYFLVFICIYCHCEGGCGQIKLQKWKRMPKISYSIQFHYENKIKTIFFMEFIILCINELFIQQKKKNKKNTM